MSKRVDILQKRLIYTEVLGWIDLGHAKGDDAKSLFSAIEMGDNSKDPYFIVEYSQYMGVGLKYGTSKITRWKVKRGLTPEEKRSVALTIMMRTSLLFESHQGSFPFNLVTDSGYSCEDLVSNLLGFYQVANKRNYLANLKIMSTGYALKLWDHYGPVGKYKNRKFRPMLFPDPERYGNNAKPYYSSLPSFMNSISPLDSIHGDILTFLEDLTGYNLGVDRRKGIQFEAQ